MIPVCWCNANPAAISRGYWDQGVLEGLFDRSLWRPPLPLEFDHSDDEIGRLRAMEAGGAIVVVPGEPNAPARYSESVFAFLAELGWWLLIVTGDEQRLFPLERLPDNKRSAVWTTGARPEGSAGEHRISEVLGFGFQPAVRAVLHLIPSPPEPLFDVSFVGQVTHERREQMADAMEALPARLRQFMVENSMFGGTASPDGSGLTPSEYAAVMAATKIAPAPSGPVIPDSFRLFEALEAGALPLADTRSPKGLEPDYWTQVCGASPPFPVVSSWLGLSAIVDEALANWPANANRACSWWAQRKRTLALRLDSTVRKLQGENPPDSGEDEITVLITTSPSPRNPSTDDIEEVIASVRAQLPDAEILIGADGVRPEQTERAAAYEEYLRNLIWRTRRMHNVCVFRQDDWLHQARTTAALLEEVVTPLVLFMEHDTPLVGPPIPWEECAAALHAGGVDLIRFHHESHVLEPHEHLMIGEPEDVEGVLLQPTVQWSQRPHLTSTLWYRSLLSKYFGAEARTMIEDSMHGVVDYHWRTFGHAGWEQFRLWLFAERDEGGSIQRSTHLDSRGDDPKYPMHYAYDGERPVGAPAPTRRVAR